MDERKYRFLAGAALVMRLAQMPIRWLRRLTDSPLALGSTTLCADTCLAGRSAVFMSGFVGIGLVPDLGGTWWLPRTVGAPRARRLVLGGERLDAVTASEWGIAERVVDDDHLIEEAMKGASKMAAWGSPQDFIEAKLAMLNTTDGFF